MSTVNAGSPNDHEPEEGGIPLLLVLVVAVAALIVIALIGPRVVGVLLAVIAPPEPPVPPGARLLDYHSEVYGTDTWTYGTEQDICDLVIFFHEQGAYCPVAPPRCVDESVEGIETGESDDYIATCYRDIEFSIFAMRWRFDLPFRTAPGRLRRFDLSREVFWTGILPPFRL
ncbi:MAG TPA: hypothetical protein VKY59_05200 [Spirillospora sp.]|nr:hypothetical protein [Spirillospora sp.]